jgi:GMP synthase (glutamine-hydrolysing)
MRIKEIKVEDLHPREFIREKVEEISAVVGSDLAINTLSGGVDSATVTMLGYRALGERVKTYFIDNGLMRQDEPQEIVLLFKKLGIALEVINAKKEFFHALKGLKAPEEKREAITKTFYKDIFGKIVRESRAKYLLQGTNYTDLEETIRGIKRQHNIVEQLGIDTKEAYGYKVIEPLIQLRKPAIREVAKALGLPKQIYMRPPFPGPALATRVIGEVTPQRIEIVRKATKIVEEELSNLKAFQYLAIVHEDKVTGIRLGKREYGLQIEVRCWDSKDAQIASPTRLSYKTLDRLAQRLTSEIRGVISVTYNITKKPPSTIEAI